MSESSRDCTVCVCSVTAVDSVSSDTGTLTGSSVDDTDVIKSLLTADSFQFHVYYRVTQNNEFIDHW